MEQDDLPLYDIKDSIFLKLCADVEKFGWKEFRASVPLDWFGKKWCSNYTSARDMLEVFRARGVTVQELVNVLEELEMEHAMSLVVAHRPVEWIKQPPLDVAVQQGNTLRLECKAKGFPFPKYQWYRCISGDKIMRAISGQQNQDLEISNIQKSDAGTYTCAARNWNRQGKKFKIVTNYIKVVILTKLSIGKEDSVPEIPVIIIQPVAPNGFVEIGSTLKFTLKAAGKEPLKYQWFDNKQPVKNNNHPFYEVEHIMPDICDSPSNIRRREIQCFVTNDFGSVPSDLVQVLLSPHTEKTKYHAEDKVALLIGNGQYGQLHQLKSAVEDVSTLANLLHSMKFKVIALCNLTLTEMINAVNLFCSFLDKGVYGLFYYAGHGFEWNNQRYMLPVNAMSNYGLADSLCAEYVYSEMEKRKPRLAALLFDMCRTEPDRNLERTEVYKADPHPNFIIAYSTMSQCQAYELQGQKNGIFMMYLKDFITQPIPFKTVIDKVTVAVNADKYAGHVQHPTTYIGLCEDYMLCDPIVSTKPTSEDRNKAYAEITECPNGLFFTHSPGTDVLMEVKPHKEWLLNGLDVIVRVASSTSDMVYMPFIQLEKEKCNEECNKECKLCKNIRTQKLVVDVKKNEAVFATSILDIQKIKKPITAFLSIINTQEKTKEIMRLNFHRPLIMPASLSENNQSEGPVEQDSYISNNNTTFIDTRECSQAQINVINERISVL